MRYTCPSVLKRSFTVPVFDWILRIFLQEDLYRAKLGPSKNKKLFPVPIGALTKKFPSLKKRLNFWSLKGQIFS